ncbi:MAG: recombinase family protein [Solirubrobacterales bacterium]|nr:recombinase family protein [Solirubrobacterales bacterium]
MSHAEPRPATVCGDTGPSPPPALEPSGYRPRLSRSAKIQAQHLRRLAIVYVRQSSPQQVLHHRESTALQYDLRRYAVELGWAPERVLVIDEDQATSGQTAVHRSGFHRLLEEVDLDHVGIILGIEMSRLARSCRDWYHLMEKCALYDTLLADPDGIYDPAQHNDRLLLGLKATMSEAELHILRARMTQGRLHKARRGAVYYHPPLGYVRTPAGEFALDPDPQVQETVRLLFDKLDALGTVTAVLRYLVRNQIRLGVRPHFGPHRGQLEWRRPCRPTLLNLYHNPIYAGAYVHGKRPVDPRRKIPGRPATGRTVAQFLQWEVLIKDHLPAYITWERYVAHVERLAANRARAFALGAPREGPSLLAGLLVCGRCGCRMMVAYGGPQSRLTYGCHRQRIEYAGTACQSLAGRVLDELVSRQVLEALEPAALELSLAATAGLEQERQRLERDWQQRRQRAHEDVERAARFYHAVDPENRLVALELERRWEQALRAERALQEQYDRFVRGRPRTLGDSDRELIRSLAGDLPRLWGAPTTTVKDRQTIIRLLVQQVVVLAEGSSEHVDVTIQWSGGFVSRHRVRRPVARHDQLSNYAQLLERVAALHDQGQTAAEIAATLNREGFLPPKRRATYNRGMVHHLLARCGRSRGSRSQPEGGVLGKNEWWLNQLAQELGMPSITLHSWRRRGWVRGRKLPGGQMGRWILWADGPELDRLRRLRACPRGWSDEPYPLELITPVPVSGESIWQG